MEGSRPGRAPQHGTGSVRLVGVNPAMATFSCNRSHPQNPGLGGCSSAPCGLSLQPQHLHPAKARSQNCPCLPSSPLCFPLWLHAVFCSGQQRQELSAPVYSLFGTWGPWPLTAWPGCSGHRVSGLDLLGPQPSQGQFLVSACSPICDSSGAGPSVGPMLGEGTARPGLAAGRSDWEPAGPSAVGLWGVCSGQSGRSCWCARGVWPDTCQQLSFISAFQSWCADLGDREPCVAVNHRQRLSLSHTGMELSQGRGPSRRSRALSWSRAWQAG